MELIRLSQAIFLSCAGAGQEYSIGGPWLEKYFAFREELSKLFGYPIDLVMSSAMKSPYFVREANRTRRLLYGA